jgi:NADH:ubiquinone oxidoreductase subunit C
MKKGGFRLINKTNMVKFFNQHKLISFSNLNIRNKKKLKIFFFLETFITLFKKYVRQIYLLNNCRFISLKLKSYKDINSVLFLLKNYYQFEILSDIIAVDYFHSKNIFNTGCDFIYSLNNDKNFKGSQFFYLWDDMKDFKSRFQLNYMLYSIKHNIYINIGVTPEGNKIGTDMINSCIQIYKNANWLERECWDMFGILFINHSDLRRILTDYGFNGFPLRKDFPVCGFVELRYDDEKKSLLYQPVELTQTFRYYKFINPWDIYANA